MKLRTVRNARRSLILLAATILPISTISAVNPHRPAQNDSTAGHQRQLNEVTVTGLGLRRVKTSAFNVVALDASAFENSTKSLSDALQRAPGIKLRESGGTGSDLQLMMDGFSGKHVKVFIDGVPQEDTNSSFSINNIPVNMADRIEVYKGVVPVQFGTDAIGGVVNVVTKRNVRPWTLDVSYAGGSFNTHKSNVNFSQNFKNSLFWQLTAFQNYSDNSYKVDAAVENFQTGAIDRSNLQRVKRFNDNFHNEAAIVKFGVKDVAWADKISVGLRYSRYYKEIQTGVRQVVVYGQKHRHGHSLVPTFEYYKRDLFTPRLVFALSANLSIDRTTNVDTATVKYNWLGQTRALNSPGEQSYQLSQARQTTLNVSATATYTWRRRHQVVVNNQTTAFHRRNADMRAAVTVLDAIAKNTTKNITGVSYRYMPSSTWNASAFGKLYSQSISGPIATSAAADNYERLSRTTRNLGGGAAATWFLPIDLQAKLSYEYACRLPSIDEMFGDEDLENGDISIKPERSHNLNLNLSWSHLWEGGHSLMVEGSLIYRDTRDYIQRNIENLSGGKYAATYINYGKVMTKGLTFSARYAWRNAMTVGGNLTWMNIRDNMHTAMGTTAANLTYRSRMPNVPYFFTDMDAAYTFHGVGRRSNSLQIAYDNQFTREFCYYSEAIGADNSEFMVPNQWCHNLSVTYVIADGRWNISAECHNLANSKLYDNYSLQKPGRSFMAKVRLFLSK
jgi:outer membrane cobalamin receptor